MKYSLVSASILSTLALAACNGNSAAPKNVEQEKKLSAEMQFMVKYWPEFDPTMFDTAPAPDCDGAPASEKKACVTAFYCDPAPANVQADCKTEAEAFVR